MEESTKFKFPTTRADAVQQARRFFGEGLDNYSERRNFVTRELSEVSNLSPLTRHRILTEYELTHLAGPRSEKYLQEVSWRIYWKGWLEMRPTIWSDYLDSFDRIPFATKDKAREVCNGDSGVAIMDHFSRQLINTGYLHNHARMWYAAFWIHTLGLPWELGARFFMTHLLDGDPASNTLSWRWVAGLHTEGKNYLVRRSNLEKYASGLVEDFPKGLDTIDDDQARPANIEFVEHPSPKPFPELPSEYKHDPTKRVGLWIHEDDWGFHNSPISNIKPEGIFLCYSHELWQKLSPSPTRIAYLHALCEDVSERAAEHYSAPIVKTEVDLLFVNSFEQWIHRHQIDRIVFLQPFIGPATESLRLLKDNFGDRVEFVPLRRPEDQLCMSKAHSGYLDFWKSITT